MTKEFLREPVVLVLFSMIAYGAITGIFLLYKMYISQKRKTDEFKTELSEIREMLEGQVYSATDRLTRHPSRWTELNHLLLSASNLKPDRFPSPMLFESPLLRQNGIDPAEILPSERFVFVLMPFHSRYYDYYRRVKKVCEVNNYECSRGDDDDLAGHDIFRSILRNIVRARIIIANIDGRNPNVFYELGIAHSFGKEVILTAESIDKVPFDMRNRRILIYRDLKDLEMSLEKVLRGL